MRIAVFSDIHGNLNGLNAVLDAVERQGGADVLVAAGDLLAAGPRPVETYERLVEAGCRMLRGNHEEYMLGRGLDTLKPEIVESVTTQDRWSAQMVGPAILAELDRLPFELRFTVAPGHALLIVHANPRTLHGPANQNELDEAQLEEFYGGETGTDIIAFGHHHMSGVREWQGRRLVNVASVAYPKDAAHLASYTLFDWDVLGQSWQVRQFRVPFDWQEEAALLRTCGMPGDLWQITRYYSD